MPKSVFQPEYERFRAYLRQTRLASGLTQAELAARLAQTQSFVSKCERGERRLDVIELRAFCLAMGTTLQEFARGLESALAE